MSSKSDITWNLDNICQRLAIARAEKVVPRTYTLPSTGIKAESQRMHGSNVAAKGGRRRWLLRKSNLRIRWLDNVSERTVILRGCCTTTVKS